MNCPPRDFGRSDVFVLRSRFPRTTADRAAVCGGLGKWTIDGMPSPAPIGAVTGVIAFSCALPARVVRWLIDARVGDQVMRCGTGDRGGHHSRIACAPATGCEMHQSATVTGDLSSVVLAADLRPSSATTSSSASGTDQARWFSSRRDLLLQGDEAACTAFETTSGGTWSSIVAAGVSRSPGGTLRR